MKTSRAESETDPRERARSLAARLRETRAQTLRLTDPLTVEDQQVQSMSDVSPTKWHLAHTTWFFETFVLERLPGYQPFHPHFRVLYNSYYQQVGDRHPRPDRGLISRPSLEEVHAYRRHVEDALLRALESEVERIGPSFDVLELGLNHEQQHQELLLMDIGHVLSCNPLGPAYRPESPPPAGTAPALRWFAQPEGLLEIGHRGAGFSFDNELPRHRVFLPAFEMASRAVTNGEFLEFVEDGGYESSEWWLSDAWDHIQQVDRWRAPHTWQERDGEWTQFTLHGREPLRTGEPVVHLSYYEAEAYARWAGARLPTEAEWERVAGDRPVEGNLLEAEQWHPRAASAVPHGPDQLFGDVWEWTQSAYAAYPGYRPAAGAIGEYNGKFMANQFVLRGGCFATPRSHLRASYRNFFHPWTRWHFGGLRLARDV